jgi:hypothetical protein
MYDGTFGRFRSITDPTIGNHEYYGPGTVNTKGYFHYWNNPPHYYSFDTAGWHIISLDTNSEYGQIQSGSGQYQRLAQDSAPRRHPVRWVFFHHPRYSIDSHGSNSSLGSL